MRSKIRKETTTSDGEFLWLVSLSDLMILLFVFFVVLFSFSYTKLDAQDFAKINAKFSGQTPLSPLDEIQSRLLQWTVDKNLLDSVNVEKKKDALILEIKEKLLFSSGDFHLKGESKELVKLIGTALEKVPAPYRIGIEGHTDDMPLRKAGYVEDNWELSVRRAHSVLQALNFPPEQVERTVIMGYAHTRPLVANRDEKNVPIVENQGKNRRVTIRIF